MRTVAIIPARWGSTRFPGKPLAMIGDKPMIQRVYEQVAKAALIDELWVATDDVRILDAVGNFGGCATMTSSEHKSGTNRCAEVARRLLLKKDDIVINVQGDEPLIDPVAIEKLAYNMANSPNIKIATLISHLRDSDKFDENKVKVQLSPYNWNALQFSRQLIGSKSKVNYKHIGVYAYSMNVLQEIDAAPPQENRENLEQLTWTYHITCIYTPYRNLSVDTPEDLEAVKKALGYE